MFIPLYDDRDDDGGGGGGHHWLGSLINKTCFPLRNLK